jgi:hypothetical protein
VAHSAFVTGFVNELKKEGEPIIRAGYAHFCEVSGAKYEEGLERPEVFMKASDKHLAVDEEPLEKLTAEDSEAT